MSKLLGKLLCKELGIVEAGSCSIKYIQSSDSFEFKWNKSLFKLKRKLVSCVAEMTNTFNWMYQWSVGYKTMIHLSDISLLRRRELNYVAGCLIESFRFGGSGVLDDYSGSKALLMSGWLESDTDFDNLCMVQHLFCLSPTILNSVVIQWKRKKWGRSSDRWMSLDVRNQNWGRHLGAKGKKVSEDEFGVETDEEFFSRIEHNKEVAVSKGFLIWYLEACKEECKRRGEPFSREKYVEEWNELRKSY